MRLLFEMSMDNAAFAEDGHDGRWEAARVLDQVRTALKFGSDRWGRLRDANGNVVGTWRFQPDAD